MSFRKSLAALASTGVILGFSTAQAVLTAGTDDIFIGFHQTGNNSDYLINIGSAQTLLTATGPITFSIGTTASDLQVFGPNWYTDSTIFWGAVGTNEGPVSPVLYSTVARTDAGTVAAPWSLSSGNTAQRNVSNQIKNLKLDYRNYGEATPNSSVATFQSITGLSFAYADFTSESPNFGGTWLSIEGNLAASSPKVLDLYSYSTTAAVHLGTLTLDSGGTITFTPVPEPSTAALIGLGLLALKGMRRRVVSRAERVAP
jgi:hypothetical protein